MFSEVIDYMGPGLNQMEDSLWFEAQMSFDSALVKLAELSEIDSLDESYYKSIEHYKKRIYKLLIEVTSQITQLQINQPWTVYWNNEMETISEQQVIQMDSISASINPADYTLPVELPLHPKILKAMAVLMKPGGRRYFTKWLNRKSKYEKMIHGKLKESGLPEDLIYLAMIESGFSPKAWSKASASGVWQFIRATGKRYGLSSNWWVDERRDPEKATGAALAYLGELYTEFGDWYQAMAGYNCGENRIRRQRREDSTRTYWDMQLPRETRKYVPKIIAAMIIGHNPKKYGFQVNPEPEIVYDTVSVFHCLSLETIAKAAESSVEDLKTINPELKRWCTPPNAKSHILRIPVGKREIFLSNYAALDKENLVSWYRHKVSRGENLGLLSRKYGVPVAAIKSTNNLRGNIIRIGQRLIIPVPSSKPKQKNGKKAIKPKKAEKVSFLNTNKTEVYRVRSGDNLYDIAKKFRMTSTELMKLNKLNQKSVLHPGQKIIISVPKKSVSPKKNKPSQRLAQIYRVKAGDNLGVISLKLKVSLHDLKKWNGLNSNNIRVGQKLKYHSDGVSSGKVQNSSTSPVYYQVKPRDNLWDIAMRYKISVKKIEKLNPNLPAVLKPGMKIRIK